MRHTRRHAQDTYDKRTSNERKSVAFALASQFAETDEADCIVPENSIAVAESGKSCLRLGVYPVT